MPQLRPRVRIDVREAITLQGQAGPGICAIMGTATWGPLNTVQTVTSFSQILDIFQDDKAGSTSNISLIKGTDLLFGNGAGTVVTVRIADGTEAKAELDFAGGAGAVADVITVFGFYEGTYGNNIKVTVSANAGTPANRDVEITDGISLEIYNNNGAGFATNQAVVNAINAGSAIASATVKVGQEIINLIDTNGLGAFLVGGLDGDTALIAGDYTTAFDNVLTSQDFDILVLPGSNTLEALDSFHSTIVGKLNTRATSEDKFAIFVSGVTTNETIAAIQARTASGSRLTLVAPNVKYTQRIDGTDLTLNGTYLACNYAGGIASRLVSISPTHKVVNVEGLSVDTVTGKEFYNNGEQEQILTARVVPITKIQGSIMASRGVTRDPSTTSVFYEQNIVRIVDFVRAQALATLNPFIGNPNISRIRNIIAKETDGLLEQDKLDEILVNYLPTQVNEGPSPDTVLVSMTIMPTFAINFINVTLTLTRIAG